MNNSWKVLYIYIYTQTRTQSQTFAHKNTHLLVRYSTNQTALKVWFEFASTSFNLSSCCAFLLLVLLVKRLQIGSYTVRYLNYSIYIYTIKNFKQLFISFYFLRNHQSKWPSDSLQLDSQPWIPPTLPSHIVNNYRITKNSSHVPCFCVLLFSFLAI